MSWNFTIDDSSSYIKYLPSEDTGLGNNTSLGWDPYWGGSGGFLPVSDQSYGRGASGQSLHVTTLDGASLSFEIYGNSVCLHGTSNGTFDVAINDITAPGLTANADGVLYCQQDLPTNVNYVNLTAHVTPNSGQQLAFDYAEVTYDFSTGATSPEEVVYNNTDTSAVHYTANWTSLTIAGAPSTTSSIPIHKTTAYGASASLNFTGEAIAVYRFRSWGSYLYNITLDEDPPHQYNGSTLWELTNSLLFFQAGIDPTASHNIKITNAGGESYYKFYLNSISVFKSNSTNATQNTPASSSPPKASTGDIHHHTAAIIGGVVGGVGGLLLIIGLAVYFLHRRPSPSQYRDISPYIATNAGSDPQAGTIQTSSSSLLFANGARQAQGLPAKGTGLASTPATSQTAQEHAVTTPHRAGVAGHTGVPHSMLPTGPESPAGSTAATVSSVTQPVNVDRIIEMIAERIDRRSSPPHDAGDAPPRYRDSAV
ncbi:uncharacterized protein B0H18DRAFT_418127 [Fomitopsis serialis]|uniref:uncharacterized protein n=1 Tax=Fomitopsis serialis TaxID=139415 RepID=UPI0020077050|nr:uncharacterized protein B0H18DRAFT_418127 [Neoantrodia serialis]KAH9935601.1 hypothetical protein B0H18DRAFT_418127 [Neoantrodia serialis]